MEVRRPYIGESRNMESKVIIHFVNENKDIEINIKQPNLSELVHSIISEHLEVSEENLEIKTQNESFDKEGFKEILIETHDEFREEIDNFYENIKKEISTYYEDEELSNFIIESIKKSNK